MNILGISAYYHDSAAALIQDGVIVAAAQEERFSRKKHDAGFPVCAAQYCLSQAGIQGNRLDAVAFYDKPITKFARILETYFNVAPWGLNSFLSAMPVWLKQKLWIPLEIEKALESAGIAPPEKLYFPEHHESHAASAFYPSPFRNAAVLTLDGVGEWATSSIGIGDGNQLTLLQEMRFPHSLGLLYSAFTYFTGFKVNSGEYKLMGLAPYGAPRFANRIRDELLDLREDGSFRLNLTCFGFLDSLRMTNRHFAKLFEGPARKPESEITQREMDIAASIQEVTEEIVLRMARHAVKISGQRNLCMAGGVALNCVANGKLLRSGICDHLWIQPAAGDAGAALGAALLTWHKIMNQPRHTDETRDTMQGSFLGPAFSDAEIGEFLQAHAYPATCLPDPQWAQEIARRLADGQVVGLFQGRMEFGPRALGNRSILGDARSPEMQSIMNLKIKYRESFRPFAPSCLEEKTHEYFDIHTPSPYMLLVADVRNQRRLPAKIEHGSTLREKIHQTRSDIPAVTHVDYSARIQTVSREQNPRYYDLIQAFEKLTGCAVVINTSFNVRGEPIVCTPEDAYRCFMRTEMDTLVLGSWVLNRQDQPAWQDKTNWRTHYTLD